MGGERQEGREAKWEEAVQASILTRLQYAHSDERPAYPEEAEGSQMITSLVVTGGNAHDGKQFPKLVGKDEERGLPADTYAADRGYDDGENHYLLETLKMHSAIMLDDYRTEKKNENKQAWIDLKQTVHYQAGTKERYPRRIEWKFGEAKTNHGLRRCRYVGRLRNAVRAYMTFIALNVKRMVRLLTGVSFKGRARAMANA